MLNMRNVVGAHLSRERFDVLLAVLVPLVLMLESGYANAWVFGGGHLGWDVNSVLALFRGIFLEALIFACFKLVKVFAAKHLWLVTFIPALVGMVGMVVSAGCNLGWMTQSPEMIAALHAVSTYLPHWMADTFRIGLGLLFPVAVGVFALFDVGHLIDDALDSSHLDHRALLVSRAEQHRTAYLKEQKQSIKNASKQYKSICEVDAQNMVGRVQQGDLTFGASEVTRVQPVSSSVTRLNAPVLTPQLPAGPARSMSSPYGQGQSTIQGQYGPAPTMHMGNTQNLNVPPPPMQPQQGGWFGNFLNGNR